MIGDLPAHALAVGLDIGPEGLICYRAPGAGGEIYEDVAREERLDYARQAVALRGSLHALQEARRGLAPREVEHLCVRLDVGPADTEPDEGTCRAVAFVDREDLPLDEDHVVRERRASLRQLRGETTTIDDLLDHRPSDCLRDLLPDETLLLCRRGRLE